MIRIKPENQTFWRSLLENTQGALKRPCLCGSLLKQNMKRLGIGISFGEETLRESLGEKMAEDKGNAMDGLGSW